MQESTSPSSSPPSFVNVMEKQESFSPTPVLPRLDRLDRLLQLLEEKHNLSSSGTHNKNTVEKVVVDDDDDDEDQHLQKTLSSALEEVQLKGNLVERLAMLETRVLQLSLAIDEGDASKSSPSTVEGYEKSDHGYDASSPKQKQQKQKQEDDQLLYGQGRKSPLGLHGQETCGRIKHDTDADTATLQVQPNGTKQSKKVHNKWLRWFNPSCSRRNMSPSVD